MLSCGKLTEKREKPYLTEWEQKAMETRIECFGDRKKQVDGDDMAQGHAEVVKTTVDHFY